MANKKELRLEALRAGIAKNPAPSPELKQHLAKLEGQDASTKKKAKSALEALKQTNNRD